MTAGEQPQPAPWLTIWFKPRETIRHIVDTDPDYRVFVLAMLVGIAQALDRASSKNAGDTLPVAVILLLCVVLGPIGGLVSVYIGGALFRWIGGWFGGTATSAEVRAAIVWSSLPVIGAMVLWIPKFVLFGEEIFTSTMPRTESNPGLLLALMGFLVIDLIAAIWTFILLLKCLGEVHRFSAWRALGVVILSWLIIIVPIALLVVAMSLMA